MDIPTLVSLAAIGVGLWSSIRFGIQASDPSHPGDAYCKDGTCIRIAKTKYGRLFFKIPNWKFGILFFLALIVCLWLPAWMGFGLILASCALSIYLLWALWVKLKAHCPLCYVAHACNALLLIFWLLRG